jgi:hypothetical protein
MSPGGSTALAQPPQAAAPTLSDIASYEGPDREKRLIEGAKKEGELMFYSSIPVEDIAALTAAFDKKYGVKVKVWRADFRRPAAAYCERGQGAALRGRRHGGLELGARAALPRTAAAGR